MTERAVVAADLSPEHLLELRNAKELLENPHFAVQAVSFLGVPIEQGINHLPANWRDKILAISNTALEKAATRTMERRSFASPLGE